MSDRGTETADLSCACCAMLCHAILSHACLCIRPHEKLAAAVGDQGRCPAPSQKDLEQSFCGTRDGIMVRYACWAVPAALCLLRCACCAVPAALCLLRYACWLCLLLGCTTQLLMVNSRHLILLGHICSSSAGRVGAMLCSAVSACCRTATRPRYR